MAMILKPRPIPRAVMRSKGYRGYNATAPPLPHYDHIVARRLGVSGMGDIVTLPTLYAGDGVTPIGGGLMPSDIVAIMPSMTGSAVPKTGGCSLRSSVSGVDSPDSRPWWCRIGTWADENRLLAAAAIVGTYLVAGRAKGGK